MIVGFAVPTGITRGTTMLNIRRDHRHRSRLAGINSIDSINLELCKLCLYRISQDPKIPHPPPVPRKKKSLALKQRCFLRRPVHSHRPMGPLNRASSIPILTLVLTLVRAMPSFALMIRTKVLEVDCHRQQRPLQASGDNQHTPNTPPGPTRARRQTSSPDKTARRLDAHHGDAQAADAL